MPLRDAAHITLGYFLDGHACPSALQRGEAVVGAMVLGPMGLLGMLQAWLGLPGEPIPGGRRIAQCLKAARACCTNGNPFYGDSLTTAPWATAKRLLELRDALALAGWQGQRPEDGQRGDGLHRLRDLAALEALLPHARDLPARLAAVIAAVRRWPLPQPLQLTLLEPRESWPGCWQRLFAVLQEHGAVFTTWNAPPVVGGNSDLACVQQRLSGQSGERKPQARADGSLTLLVADSVEEAAEAVALLLPLRAEGGSTVLLRSDPDLVLEEALARFHQPTTGYAPESRWRSILQLLPICLRMRWQPRSMQALLDFLLLPEAPVCRGVRYRLVRALREYPGIGNEVWEEQAADARGFLRVECGDAVEGEAQWEQAFQWLLPDEVPETPGMPLATVQGVCNGIAQWARGQVGHTAEGGLFTVLAAQAEELALMAQEAGEAHFSRPTLEAMLDHQCALGATHVFSTEEAAPWQLIEHPGQLHGSVDTLLWWQFRTPAAQRPLTWTDIERCCLANWQCAPESPLVEHRLRRLAWQRALGLTRQRCILVAPRRDNGEDVVLHPLWEHLANAFHKESAARGLIRNAREVLEGTGVQFAPVAAQDMPGEPDCLHLGQQPLLKEISFTDAQNAMHCAFRGLLGHRLHPRGHRGIGTFDIRQLCGTFSHYLVQCMLESSLPALKNARKVMEELVEKHLPTHAAPLLEEQHALERADFAQRMADVAESLVLRVKAAGLHKAQLEHGLERQLPGRESVLQGRADVYWSAPGAPVIWDLKWSFGRKKYQELLDKGTAYQLVAYAWMSGHAAAEAAYWLLPIDAFMGTKGSGASEEKAEVYGVDLPAAWESMARALEERFCEWERGEAPLAPRNERNGEMSGECGYCPLSFVCGRKYA